MKTIPLATLIRPKTLDEYVGQEHILSKGKLLYESIKSGQPHSMILWGCSGIGKTTIAEIIFNETKCNLIRLSAVTCGIKEIRDAIETAKSNKKNTILFIDEIHHFNKSQQDTLLPHVEDGTIILIGATTENPAFALNNAILSRVKIYNLKKLSDEELKKIIQRALNIKEATITDEALEILAKYSNSDARIALNTLELVLLIAKNETINTDHLKQVLDNKVLSYDNRGDLYYNMISAFHKSVRGSAPDAALYWFARILESGGDALQVARRLVAIASEDIGNADPVALQIVLNAFQCYQLVGPAEGERAIAQAILYCSLASKSNATYEAWEQVKADLKTMKNYDVPIHLCNATTNLTKSMGYGADYRYAHHEPNAFAAGENFFPEEISDKEYYHPKKSGLEKDFLEKIKWIRHKNKVAENKRYEK